MKAFAPVRLRVMGRLGCVNGPLAPCMDAPPLACVDGATCKPTSALSPFPELTSLTTSRSVAGPHRYAKTPTERAQGVDESRWP